MAYAVVGDDPSLSRPHLGLQVRDHTRTADTGTATTTCTGIGLSIEESEVPQPLTRDTLGVVP